MTSPTSAVDDEIFAVSAIFGDMVEASPATAEAPARVAMSVPWASRKEPVVATFSHTPGSSQTWRVDYEGFPRGTVAVVQSRVASVQSEASPDAPVLFLLLEELRAAVEELSLVTQSGVAVTSVLTATPSVPQVPVPVFHGCETVQQKSTFQAHVAHVRSRADVANVLAQLHADSRIARATHNMYAYRIVQTGAEGGPASIVADNDDDGEDAAGSRLAHLLELMAADNLLVVVSRWFGGVLMGPSRFKAINEVARIAIEGGAKQAGWYSGRRGGKVPVASDDAGASLRAGSGSEA